MTIAGESACRACGSMVNLDRHHAVPRSLAPGARDNELNLILLCRRCHSAWHAGTPLLRTIFTAAEWEEIRTLIGPGWLARHYPPAGSVLGGIAA